MIQPGQIVRLLVEKPAAGGSMIARTDGQIVLVAGAIPGERVRARIDKVRKNVAYALVEGVEEPSPDRREPFTDPLCGGCLFAHISYARQLEIKAQIVADAFARIGGIRLSTLPEVVSSRTDGYRMRTRVHFRGGRLGFFREGSHTLCDPRSTRQLLPQTCDVVEQLAAALQSVAIEAVGEVEISENADATRRVAHLVASSPFDVRRATALGGTAGLTGLTVTFPQGHGNRSSVVAGDPYVVDVVTVDGSTIRLRRHVEAFFQGNRYLLADLVRCVTDQIDNGSAVVDLYAGTGLFAVAAAIARKARVAAVEGDRTAALDLSVNAMQTTGAVQAFHQSVEAFVATTSSRPDALVVDPPRTGLSRDALNGILGTAGRRVIYVSCDPATLARDGRRLAEGGYELRRVHAFDLFPNTPHIETVVVFERAQ